MLIAFEVAGFPEVQLKLDVRVHVTTSPLARVLELNVAILEPADIPLTAHAYVGLEPALVPVAVKVTFVPEQMLPDGTAAIDTPTGKLGFTDMVTEFDVAGLPVAQLAFEVITQLTTSPFVRVVDV